jgi:predicted nucleic acid-binding protein
MRYVLDTNVVSETTKPAPHPRCVAWLLEHAADCCVTTITLAEMRYGLERLPDGKKKRDLTRRYDFLRQKFGDWVLDFDESAATEFGRYVAEFETERGLQAVGEADLRDLQIAAIARSLGWTVATRNTSDFPLVETVNPFED